MKRLLACTAILLACLQAWGQDSGTAPGGQSPTGQTPAGDAPAGQASTGQESTGQASTGEAPAGEPPAGQPPEEASPVTAEDLLAETLASDIATASYYELVAWCEEEGLDSSGSRKDLQSKLSRHFGLPEPAAQQPAQDGKAKSGVKVLSASQTEYFTSEDIDEKYVVLTGDVVVQLTGDDPDTVQEVRAQRITYNQTTNVVTAEGSVTYTVTQAGKAEIFQGQSLSFNLDSSEGVFYDGSTTRTVKKGSTDLVYRFQGATISRLANDTVILENGSFTTCPIPQYPHFHIESTKTWVLAAGEWAVQNAVLWVGRVPVLYIPVFFYPGDQLVFNPSFGYRDREGTFVQTTTYLIGRKQQDQEEPFSFLQLGDSPTQTYAQEIRGLFLRKIRGTQAPQDKGEYLKVLADAYSRLGVFVGLAGSFPPQVSFRAGVGLTRSLFPGPTSGSYTPFWIEEGTATSIWNSSEILGLSVPFRFGLEGDFKSTADFYSTSARFEYFSDPIFPRDFYSRTEGFSLKDVLKTTSTTEQVVGEKRNLSWDLINRLDFSRMLSLPWMQTLSVPNFNMKLTWLSKDDPGSTTLPASADPGKTFYFPSSIAAPSASVTIGGDLLKLSSRPETKAAAVPQQPPGESGGQTDRRKSLRPPISEEASPQTPPQSEASGFREPQEKGDVTVSLSQPESGMTLSYQIQPRLVLEHTFDYGPWTQSAEVDYSILHRTLETGGTSRISATARFLDRMAELTTALVVDGNYRTHFDPRDPLPAGWETLILRDFPQDRLALTSSVSATARPFLGIRDMSASTVTYKVGLKLYQLRFDAAATGTDWEAPVFETVEPKWEKESFSEHTIQSTLSWKLFDTQDSFALTSQLPPLDPSMTARLDFGFWHLKTRVQAGVRQVSETKETVWQPLVISEAIDLTGTLNASEELQFDVEEKKLDKSVTQLKVSGFTASLSADRLLRVEPQIVASQPLRWVTIDTDPVLALSSLRLSYSLPGDPWWLWKNRVRLGTTVQTSWNMNLQRFTESNFDFTFKLNLTISEFLELSFSSLSYNSKTYRYIPAWAEAVGDTWVNPVQDLLWSFNFFNVRDRYRAGFKIRSLAIKAVHHLDDWDLSFEYSGSPQLKTLENGTRQYEWTPTYTIQIQWIPVSEIKSTVKGDAESFNLRG